MTGKAKEVWNSFLYGTILTYSTAKLVKVPNTYISVIHRILQLLIVFYIIGYIVLWKKGYQQFQEPRGTCVIKVKGVARVVGDETLLDDDMNNTHVWDTPEYAIPPIENNAFFIATHQTVTPEQTLGECPTALEDKLPCATGNTTLCKKGKALPNTFGYFTGECVPSYENDSLKVCQMRGWCPEELSKSIDYIINEDDLRTFTVYIKTLVTFTLLKRNLRNINDNTDFKCRFDGTSSTADCPIFPLSYMLDKITTNKTALFLEGGLIEIRQDWQCNFDTNPNSCVPTYGFELLQSGDDKQSPGINYRYAQKYRENGIEYRTLAKVYGLRFVVAISGKGGEFYIVNLFVSIGSGIGFMVIANIVADVFFMYFHKSRTAFREGKFSVINVTNTNNDDGDEELVQRPL